MRKFEKVVYRPIPDDYEKMVMVVGNAREIKSLYDRLIKDGFSTLYGDYPKFNKLKTYGLIYYGNGKNSNDGITIVNSDTIVSILMDDFI